MFDIDTNFPFKGKRRDRSIFSSENRFCKFLLNSKLTTLDFSALLEIKTIRRQLPKKILTESKIQTILSLPNESTYLGFRDKVILELFYNTRIRRAEAAALSVYNLNFEEKTIFISQGKGKKDRLVPMGNYLVSYLQIFLEKVRAVLMKTPDEIRLFPNNRGEAMTPGNLNQLMARYSKMSSIPFNCHTFRHSFATHMLKAGVDILYIQKLLGHENTSTTQINTQVYPADLKEIIDKFHPRSGKVFSEEEIKLPTKKKNTRLSDYKRKIENKKQE